MHYSTILFDPYFELDKSIKGVYYHDCMNNNGKITEMNEKRLFPRIFTSLYIRNMNRIDKYILNYID